MSAPAELISHGTAPAILGISDEPSSTPTVKVTQFSIRPERTPTETKNANGTTVYINEGDPKCVFGFTGHLNASSGLATQGPGSAVSSLANFAAATRSFDNAVGTLILRGIEDSTENLNRAGMTKFEVHHFPYVVTA